MSAPEHDGPADDGYQGPAQLIDGDRILAVRATLAGHFEPISGKYRWYGRLAASEALTELAGTPAAAGLFRLRTPEGEAPTRLSDLDPWNRPRVEGSGRPPFAVLTDVDPAGATG